MGKLIYCLDKLFEDRNNYDDQKDEFKNTKLKNGTIKIAKELILSYGENSIWQALNRAGYKLSFDPNIHYVSYGKKIVYHISKYGKTLIF